MRLGFSLCSAFLLLGVAFAAPAMAQPAAPDPQTLEFAKQLVAKTGGDRDQMLAALNAPMIGMMQQMGITDPQKAGTLVSEGVMPVLRDHYDDLLAMQSRSYAQVLSNDDLTAIIAFYNTKAGKDLLNAQPALAQARTQGLTQWIGSLQPELQAKIQQLAKVHGWN